MSFDFQPEEPDFDFQQEEKPKVEDQTRKGILQQFNEFLTRRSTALQSTIESLPRQALETPGAIKDILNAVTGVSSLQREAEEEGLESPVSVVNEIVNRIIPQDVQESFQSFKEFFPTFEERKQSNIQNYPEEIQEHFVDELGFEPYIDRAQNFLALSALLGAKDPRSLLGATSSGVSSQLAEDLNLSPEGQIWMTIMGGGVPESINNLADGVKNKVASTPKELAFKMIRPRLKNLKPDIIKIARDENITPSLAAVSKGGIEQFGQNTLSQTFFTKSMFDDFSKSMANEVVNAFNEKIQTMPGEDFVKLQAAASEDLGRPIFRNKANQIVNDLSDNAPPKANTGQALQQRLHFIMDEQRQINNQLFDRFKKDPALNVKSPSGGTAAAIKRIQNQKGRVALKSPQTKELLSNLEDLERMFLSDKGKAREISIKDKVAQVEELNRIIDFDESIGNQSKALIPIRQALIDDINSDLINIGRGDLAENWQTAKEQYAQFANTFGRDNRVVFDSMRDQQPERIIPRARTQSGMKSFWKALEKSGQNEPIYGELQRQVMQSIFGDNLLQVGELNKFKLNDSQAASLKEIQPLLPFDTQMLVEEVINDSRTAKRGLKREDILNTIRADVANSMMKGELPQETMAKMKTPKGLQDVREALRVTDKGQEVLQSLEKHAAQDVLFDRAINPTTQEINLNRIRTNLKQPKTRAVLKSTMGQETFNRVNKLGELVESFAEGDAAFRNFSQTETTRRNSAIVQNLVKMGGALMAGKFLPVSTTLLGIGSMYLVSKLFTDPRFVKQILDTVEIGSKSAKTPANARLYEQSVQNTLRIASDILTEEEQEKLFNFDEER